MQAQSSEQLTTNQSLDNTDHEPVLPINIELRQEIKQRLLNVVNPDNDEKYYDIYASLDKLENITDDDKETILTDPEIQEFGQNAIFDTLKRSCAGQDDWRLFLRAQKIATSLKIPRSYVHSDERLSLIKEYILKKSQYQRPIGSLVAMADLVEIPDEILEQTDIQNILPRDIGIRYSAKDLHVNQSAKYLQYYFSGNKAGPIVAEELKQFCIHGGETFDGEHVKAIDKIQQLIQQMGDKLDPEQIKVAVRDGIFDYLCKDPYFEPKRAVSMISDFGVSEIVQHDPQFREAAQNRFLEVVNDWNHDSFDIITQFDEQIHFDKAFINSPEFQQAFANGFSQFLRRSIDLTELPDNYPDDLLREIRLRFEQEKSQRQQLAERFNFSPDQAQQAVLHTISSVCAEPVPTRPNEKYQLIGKLVKSDYLLDKQLLLSPEVQLAIKTMLIADTGKNNFGHEEASLCLLAAQLPLSEEMLHDPELQPAIQKLFTSLSNSFSVDNLDLAKELANRYNLDPQYVKDTVKAEISDRFDYQYKSVQKRKDLFGLTDNECVEAISGGLRKYLSQKQYEDRKEYQDHYLINKLDEIYKTVTPDIFKAAISSAFLVSLDSDLILVVDRLKRFINKVGTSEEVFSSPQAQEGYKKAIIRFLSSDDINAVQILLNTDSGYCVQEGVLNVSEVQIIAQKFFENQIKANKFHNADSLIELGFTPCVIEDPDAQKIIKTRLISYFQIPNHQQFNFDEVENFLAKYQLPQNIYQEEEFSSISSKLIITELSRIDGNDSLIYSADGIDNVKEILKLADKLSIPPDKLQVIVEKALDKLFSSSYLDINNVGSFTNRVKQLRDLFPGLDILVINLTVKMDVEFPVMIEVFKSLDISKEIIDEIDSNTASNPEFAADLKLISFITKLSDDQINQTFPKSMAVVREQILISLDKDSDLAEYFLENLPQYYQAPWVEDMAMKAVFFYSSADKFISAVKENPVWANQPWVANVLAKADEIVGSHDDANVNSEQNNWDSDTDNEDTDNSDDDNYGDGFVEIDPYKEHPFQLTDTQIKLSFVVADLFNGKVTTSDLVENGINPECLPVLEKVNVVIDQVYENFINNVQRSIFINDDDKKSILSPNDTKIAMTPLIENVRSFVARFLVQQYDINQISGDQWLDQNVGHSIDSSGSEAFYKHITKILDEGFHRFIKVHEVDIPMYDKLYEEMDNYRETGRYPMEVYLGRDGIYAWIGRRTQDLARRRKQGIEGRRKLKEAGEVLEIHPKYLVYPRYFRDNLKYETKRQFLEQEGINPDMDPLFYDTGYTGTIPEQIMKIMDFDEDDIERRIRLLSAPTVARRVKGIPENARTEIIEYIEHNAKLEEAAKGLIIDERTGRIRHIAEPTTPEEQFYFMMVKQAISRHYWLKEQLYHEPSGNINLDSEFYGIRIRQEFVNLLPLEFIHNPKEYLMEHGTLMKSSHGEGLYPEEEILLFQLSDGMDIVAKRIELRKAKEAHKEFSILIAAKKAHLPTAEPVGFLLAKRSEDGSYLLMKKVEGLSGRTFEKYLQKSGRYSDDQIHSIMYTVAEKNKEMAELFRVTLHIDKRWRIKDTIIQFNEDTGTVEEVIPIDWERIQDYDPENPKTIDEIV